MRRHLIPQLRYADAPRAIQFLCDAFGFTTHVVHAHPRDPNIILNAQLSFGGELLMLGSATNHDDLQPIFAWKTPKQAGAVTMCIAVIVDDPNAHCEKALLAGATIIRAPTDNQEYPGRFYIAADIEGYVWTFTTYDPYL